MSFLSSIKKVFSKKSPSSPEQSRTPAPPPVVSQKTSPPATGSISKNNSQLSPANLEKYQQALKLGPGGQPAEAMKLVLSIMEEAPGNADVSSLAETILYAGYNQLGWMLINDPLLDPYFAQCARCGTFWPINPMYKMAAGLHISNPAGGKCDECGTVLCRNCAINNSGSLSCPNHGARTPIMKAVLYPTGRKRKVSPRSSVKKLAHAIILRQPPEPPRMAGFVLTILEAACSEALTDGGEISCRIYPGEVNETAVATYLMLQQTMSGWPNYLDSAKYEVNYGNFTDPDGGTSAVIRVYFS